MSDMNTTDTAPEPVDVPMVDPAAWKPAQEKPKEFGSDRAGLEEATDELLSRRQADAPIRRRVLDENAPETLNTKDAAERLSLSRKIDRANVRRSQTQEHPWVAGNVIGQEIAAEREPNIVEYKDGRPKDQPLSPREAAKDLARYRTQVAPQEAQDADTLRQLQAELGVQDLIEGEQQPAEQPAEQPAVEPEQPQPDPLAQERARLAAEHQRLQQERQVQEYLAGATTDEVMWTQHARALAQQAQQEFEGVDLRDISRLSADKQMRIAEYHKAAQGIEEKRAAAEAKRVQAQSVLKEARDAEFQRWRAHQDQLAAQAIPEINDAQRGYEFRQGMQSVMKEYLNIDAATAKNLNPELVAAINFSGFQRLVADATRYRLGQQRALDVKAKPLPPVQRPGVSQPKADRKAVELSSLSQRIDRARPGSESQLRLAASLVAQRRQARGR